MLNRDYRDMAGGLLLVLAGVLVAWYARETLRLGSLTNMGPGMMPMALGCIMAGLGALIALAGYFRAGAAPEIRIWSPLFVLAGVAAFAMTINPFGLLPAVLAVTVISSLAELKVRPLTLLVLSATLCALTYLIFSVGLGLSIPLVRWTL